MPFFAPAGEARGPSDWSAADIDPWDASPLRAGGGRDEDEMTTYNLERPGARVFPPLPPRWPPEAGAEGSEERR